MKSRLSIVLLIVLELCIAHCGKRPSERRPETVSIQPADTSVAGMENLQKKSVPVRPSESRFDGIARFLAGMEPDSTAGLSDLCNTAAWKQHRRTTDLKWKRFDANHLQPIRRWAATEFAEARKSRTVFYPFGGPDFLYATSFFPGGERYILFGLEPSGRIPDLRRIPADSLAGFLEAVNQSLDDVLSLSFFKTKDMRLELKEGKLQGNIPILMYLMVRTGNRIVDMKPIHVDTSGVVASADSFFTAPSGYFNHGVEIRFHPEGSDTVRRLIYFSVNISDYGVKDNKNVRRFLQKLDTSLTTYIKAASYLMHKKYFTAIRQTVLAKSRAILQDDSGIPYRFFDPSVWTVALYGQYTQPIDMFKEYFEADLKAAYGLGAKPVGFRLGYGAQSNLLFAVRKKP